MVDRSPSPRLLGAVTAAWALAGCASFGEPAERAEALNTDLRLLSPFDRAAIRAQPSLEALGREIDRLRAGAVLPVIRHEAAAEVEPYADPGLIESKLQTATIAQSAWLVSLGRFEDRVLAEALWAELGPLVRSLAGDVQPRFLMGAEGSVTLAAGPLTREEAGRTCAGLAAFGVECEPRGTGGAT